MGLIQYVEGGLHDLVNRTTAGWLLDWRFGLYQNDFTPAENSVIGQIDPADFSGYFGLLTPSNWSAAVIEGPRSVTRADPVYWTHDGGPVGNWIYGYYVVNLSGVLLLAQRLADAPRLLDQVGEVVTVVPTFSERPEF